MLSMWMEWLISIWFSSVNICLIFECVWKETLSLQKDILEMIFAVQAVCRSLNWTDVTSNAVKASSSQDSRAEMDEDRSCWIVNSHQQQAKLQDFSKVTFMDREIQFPFLFFSFSAELLIWRIKQTPQEETLKRFFFRGKVGFVEHSSWNKYGNVCIHRNVHSKWRTRVRRTIYGTCFFVMLK